MQKASSACYFSTLSLNDRVRPIVARYYLKLNLMSLIFPQTILVPQSPFYTGIAKDCVANGVSVDLFLFPNSYIDVATIGLLATQTGGQIYRYSYFKVGCVVF